MLTDTTEPKVYKLKPRHELIQEVEGFSDENILDSEGKQDDPKWWRRALFALNKKREELKEFKDQQRQVLDKWNEAHDKRKADVASFETYLQSQLRASKYKTKTGGYKFDMAPDFGVISIDKPRTKFVVEDEEFWKSQPHFVREVTTQKIDKKELDIHLSQFKIHGDRLIDHNGEIVHGILVEQKGVYKYKESEMKDV